MELPVIADFIIHQQCPIVDGIVYSNGEVHLIDFSVDWRQKPISKFVLSEVTSISELAANGNLGWSDCSFLAKKNYEEAQLTIFCGEGVWGSDGFVGCINSATQKLLWIAYFTESNPFCEVKFHEASIFAKSTLNLWWCLPLKYPHLLSISNLEDFD